MKKIHKYIHTFKNGDQIDVTVDLNETEPKISSTRILDSTYDPILIEEYHSWIQTVVIIDLMNRLTPEQTSWVAKYGMKILDII